MRVKQDLRQIEYEYLVDTLDARGASELSHALNACVARAFPGTTADLTIYSGDFYTSDPKTAKMIALVKGEFAVQPFLSDASRQEWAFPVRQGEQTAAALSFYLSAAFDRTRECELKKFGESLCGLLEKQLRQLNRAYPQNALARLAAEVKAPLSAALSAVQLTEEKLRRSVDEYEREYRPSLESAQRNIFRSLRMASNIMDAERLEAGQIRSRPVCGDLAATVREVVDSVRPIAESKGVRLSFDSDEPFFAAYCDFYFVERILLTLLSNALDATRENQGCVAVRFEGGQAPRITVSDNGAGVAPKDREHVFQKYWSGMAACCGRMGLGLYLARRFAELLPGELTAVSLEEGRTCFELRVDLSWPQELALGSSAPVHSNLLKQLVRMEFADF